MKYLTIIPFLALASCASFQNASTADYNGDGVISDAEYVQFNKQKDIEARNVTSESMKRRNVTNTTRDVRDGLWNVKSIQNTLKSF